jgi:hypothetical protein
MPDLKVVSSQFQSNVSALISSSIVQGILEQNQFFFQFTDARS